MTGLVHRCLGWSATWNPRFPGCGIEHVIVSGRQADSMLLGVDEDGQLFRMRYELAWNAQWRLLGASIRSFKGGDAHSLAFVCDGEGGWADASGTRLEALDGCIDIDIWPTPLTNTLPIRRAGLGMGERRVFSMVWVRGPELAFQRQTQAYTRVSSDVYRFESLDGSGFVADLAVDEDGFVRDYPGLFERIPPG